MDESTEPAKEGHGVAIEGLDKGQEAQGNA